MSYPEIERLLTGVRRRQGRMVALTAATYGLSGLAVSLLAGAGALALGAAGARGPALVVALLAMLGALGWAIFRFVRTAASEEAAARVVGRAEPAIRSDLISAVELHRRYGELSRSGRFSLALVDALITRTATRSLEIDLRRVVSGKQLQIALMALAGVALIHLVALGAGGRALGAGYRRLFRGDAVAAGAAAQRDPITGDIELSYLYPAYMNRSPKVLSGTGGEINAPKGTEVRIRARADRAVVTAQIVIRPSEAAPAADGKRPADRTFGLEVAGGRDLSGGFVVEEGGSYQFRFLTRGGRVVAEGPLLPIVIEPDAFPEVRIAAPGAEVEVDEKARVRIDWMASDDHGLSELALVLKPPVGGEERRPIRTLTGSRRDGGTYELDLTGLKLAEGEKLLYYLEVLDNDAVSGPKRAASATQVIKIYSEAEHHRAVLAKAEQLWEALVGLLGDRLEFLQRIGRANESGTPSLPWDGDRLATGEIFDSRTRHLHEQMRETAIAFRKDPAAPRELASALQNVASGLRSVEARLTNVRSSLSRLLRLGHGADPVFARRLDELDAEMTREQEKDILYLEDLFDKRKAMDLVELARELAARRRDLASLMEKYKASPTDQARKELMAEITRMKQRMGELMRRMSELARGINDEHMNAEALAELNRGQDMMGGLDSIEQMLAKGDIDGAMKALDALGSQMQDMVSDLQRTSGMPDQKNAALAKEMMAFKKELEAVQAQQQRLAEQTERIKNEYKKRLAERLKASGDLTKKLRSLTEQGRKELESAEPGLAMRDEEAFDQARGRLGDLDRALATKDFDAALEMANRALPSMQRLAQGMREEASMLERFQSLAPGKEPDQIKQAAGHAEKAIPPINKVRDELQRLFPDPKKVLSKDEQKQLEQMGQKQGDLQQRAGNLQDQLSQLMQKAPVFPQSASDLLGESRGHMRQAAGELGGRNPQKGHGSQRQALDALGRLKRGLEQMAQSAKGGGGGGSFPFPFGGEEMSGPGQNDGGDMGDPAQQKVEIPGAEAYKVPEEFRKDLLDAMKQGAPEVYRGEVQRYYEELVK